MSVIAFFGMQRNAKRLFKRRARGKSQCTAAEPVDKAVAYAATPRSSGCAGVAPVGRQGRRG
ncbi:MAG TPA: hypothetical protein VL860_13355, partial [Planctomycetota bacterium]|nr:hypothetical protein [Planctomycetota bacterium]